MNWVDNGIIITSDWYAFFQAEFKKNDTKRWYQNSTIRFENADNTEKNEELREKVYEKLPWLREKTDVAKHS